VGDEPAKTTAGDSADPDVRSAVPDAANTGEAAQPVRPESSGEETAARPEQIAGGAGPVAGAGAVEDQGEASQRVRVEDLSMSFGPVSEDSMKVASELPELPSAPVADPQLKGIIEALVFASPEPLTPKMLFKLLESEPKEDVELAIASLRQDYDGRSGGLQLVEVAGGYQIVTRPEMHEWVRRLFHERKTQKLSVQALETLAVIAYKQPITAPEMAEIRGVNTAGVLNTLLERRLIKISGRKAVVGRPFLYSTTREFLIRFGLRDLSDLPKVEDMAEVLGFEPPAGLAESGPSEGRLPLELDGETEEGEPRQSETEGGEEKVH
jgi:segregation and condensation protein B